MRSYGQYCSVAKALDVVGDRWSLLIVRELLAQGPCRFTDLRNGLPGIPPNMLSTRLRELEAAGVIRRAAAPPPIATTLIHLTDEGKALEPVIAALGQWGVRFMARAEPGDEFRSHWFSLPVSLFLEDRQPHGRPFTIELLTADRPAYVAVEHGQIRLSWDAPSRPDLTLAGEPNVILGVLSGGLSLSEAKERGLEVRGDERLLRRVVPQPGADHRHRTPAGS